MAENKTLITRIVLRNDIAEHWTNLDPVLAKGEIGLETDTNKFKIGDGVQSWTALPYATKNLSEIQKAIDDSADQTKIIEPGAEEDDVAAINAHYGEKTKGDIAIVKRLIANSTDKYTHTAYVFDGENWKAADGSYNAENVYLDKDITITAPIGVQTIGKEGYKTLDTKGKNIKEVLDVLMAEEKNPETVQPSTSIKLNEAKAYEVGTKVTPSYTVSFNEGSYSYDTTTGVTATGYAVQDSLDNIKKTQTGSFTELQVTDNIDYKLNVTTSFGDGAVPHTNLKKEYSDGQITAGTTKNTSGSITGYRNSFYGTKTDKTAVLDSTAIRALNKTNCAVTKGSTMDVLIPVGALRVVIAIPTAKHKDVEITDRNGLGATVRSSFKVMKAQVEGAEKYDAIEYTVYYLDYAVANNKENHYDVVVK